MRKPVLIVIFMLAVVMLFSGCVTVPPERSVKTYAEELKAAQAALADARARGAREECPAAYMAAAMKKDAAVDIFWSCRTAEAIAMLREARADADKLCGETAAMVVDSDGDGVPDDTDQCPGTPKGAKVDSRGCWVLRNLHFDLDKSEIKPESYPVLDEAVSVLKQNPDLRVEIQGHTDTQGTAEYNKGLSERRADAVKAYIVGKGIDSSRLTTEGFGFTRPIADNATEEGRALNRRVELKPLR